jgi:hypothetical protein
VVVLAVLFLSTAWCIPHLGVSCAILNSSSIRATTHNTGSDSSSHNSSTSSSSSVMLLLHLCSRHPSGQHSSFLLATFHASTVGRWGTLLINATSPSKATHHELRHPWSTSREANRRALHHELAAPTTIVAEIPREKKC